MPSISAIVPTLNEAEHIEATLAALRRIPGLEVVLVDGGSTDGTIERASDQVDTLERAAPGRAGQMNAGAEVARGDVLWFVHADTRVPAEAGARIDAAVAGGRAWGRFDVRLSGRHPGLAVVAWFMNRRSCLTGIATGDQGIFVTRSAFDAVGGYPAIPLMEDVAMSRRLKRLGRPACLAGPLETSGRRWEANGLIRTVLLMWRLRLAYALGVDPARLHRRYRLSARG
ncbi:TIGR04283 family arsenosugar biosynthesis glycosyltransferase [Ectothiorhodospiraceae bacterium WFHF3C12]|nr:TIGR04283 family arsenosugar biosynthesis glycosyltransferase [Ectothiorhodospiraceae bacterium WFHF3C12]